MVGYEVDLARFSLYRFLTDRTLQCVVIAPRDRVKIDRRDAMSIA